MIYLTGGGLNPKTLPTLTGHPMIGALAQPESLALSYVMRFDKWGADNGCFAKPKSFVLAEYFAWLEKMSPALDACLFATAPDVVGDCRATWEKSEPILPEIRKRGYPAALVGQDGIEDESIDWDALDVLFIGGSTRWKLSDAARQVVGDARRFGKWVHMGRVNSFRRLEYAALIGCDSADGNFLAFGPDTNLPKLLRWLSKLKQCPMLGLYV